MNRHNRLIYKDIPQHLEMINEKMKVLYYAMDHVRSLVDDPNSSHKVNKNLITSAVMREREQEAENIKSYVKMYEFLKKYHEAYKGLSEEFFMDLDAMYRNELSRICQDIVFYCAEARKIKENKDTEITQWKRVKND